MRIGYPCINTSIGCCSSRTFRLSSYSVPRFKETLANNLNCLHQIISWNIAHNILFFRISSDLVPFASHPICTYPWQQKFKKEFCQIGSLIHKHNIRISMHPDQFVLLNARDKRILNNSIRELVYHSRILDLLNLPMSAKIQIHVGGVYGNKTESIKRFAVNYYRLPRAVKRRLVIENDDRMYNVSDCLEVHKLTGVPVLLDSFHHEVNPDGNNLKTAFRLCARTWRKHDGTPMVDYSSQQPGARPGTHATAIDLNNFRHFFHTLAKYEFDLMLEIKDKEKSALTLISWLNQHRQNLTGRATKLY